MRLFSRLRGWRRRLAFCLGLPLLLTVLWALFAPRPPLLEGVPFSVAVYDRHGRLMRLGLAADEKYRIFTPLEQISPTLREGALLYEDRYFYSHFGVNPVSLLRAAHTTYLSGDRRLGASTITMQLARLRLKLDTGNLWGKLRQIERALAYELHYSKEQIFEAYLNLAPYGGNIEGCGAAAQIYFQKSPDKLDLIESLSLVSVPQNPARRNPLAVRRLDEEGRRDAALEEARARLYGLWLENHPEDSGSGFMNRLPLRVHTPADLPFRAPHVTTEALRLFPASNEIYTSIDSRQQQLLERMIASMTQRNRSLGVNNAAALLLHWPSMEVRALVGSADFFNPAIEGQIDGSRARRSPGSTLKPFIYALALDQGIIHPRSLLYDTQRSFKGYDPENADQEFKGPLHATEALQMSRNIPAISLANELGRVKGEPDLYGFLRRAGVEFPHNRDHYGLTLVLGGAELSMRELAALYALLPNQGRYRELRLFRTGRTGGEGWAGGTGAYSSSAVLPDALGIPDPVGPAPAVVYDGEAAEPNSSRLLSPEAAIVALRMLRALPANQRIRNASIVGRIPMYWKTGTSNGLRDAWTAGVFGPYVLVVWVGDFNNASNQNFVGLRVAAPLFWDIADAIYNSENIRDQSMQGMEDLNLIRIKVCAATGDIDTSLCADTAETWFIPGVSPIADSGVYRRVLIDKTSGLRACVEEPGKTERVVMEFWPTDLLRLFRQAGVIKPSPPPFMPECEGGVVYGGYSGGLPPEILSPKEGVTYHRSVTRPEGSVVTLHASGDADATDFYWFSGKSFIGRSTPAEHIVWTPPGGINIISVVDNLGRSSSVKITVQQSE
ncbi:MAG: penicillin-binding protein 1C [Deltaproteobacteria bacterium]|jgi:penicillin-binding protein 1C|nr:penicillin-binding protein 1C [Deltaproteobacteria bacterium]